MFTENLDGQLIITPNNRMKSQLTELFAVDYMKRNGVKVAPAANAYSMEAWITEQYSSLRFKPKYQGLLPLVSTSYLYTMFLNAIKRSQVETVMDISELASEVSTAYSNLMMWNVPQFKSYNLEHEEFLNWVADVEQQIKNMKVVFVWDAFNVINKAIIDGDIKIKTPVCMFGYDDYPPKVQDFITALNNTNVPVNYSYYDRGTKVEKLILESETQSSSFDDVANLVYNLHKEDRTKKIAIIHPELHKSGNADKLISSLTQVFEPQYILPQTTAYVRPFNVTFGSSITSEPIVEIAFKLWQLLEGELYLEDVLKLVKSPFLKNAEGERIKRNKVASNLTGMGVAQFDLQLILRNSATAPLLNAQLRKMNLLNKTVQVTAKLSHWVDYLVELLKEVGWAKGRKLNSNEYQAYNKFAQALEEVKQYDLMVGDINYNQALSSLKLLLNQVMFKAESDPDTPIQVMGLLEAAGMTYDVAIMMQMDAATWPSISSPSPYIPLEVQVENKMPHCDAARELEFARNITNRIELSTSKLIFSYHTKEHGEENLPSNLISGELLEGNWLAAPDIDYFESEIRRIPCRITEDELSELPPGPQAGGVAVVKDTIACPFMGQVSHRAKIKDFPVPEQGLTRVEQGNILHKALETFWEATKSQEVLLSLSDDELREQVVDAVEVAFFSFERSHIVGEHLIALESERLTTAILIILELEKKRPAFIVDSIEERGEFEIAGLTLTYRKDRKDLVDFDGDGEYEAKITLDHKSGSVSMAGLSDKLSDPQLAIQSNYDEDDIDGVGYIGYKKNEEKLVGLGSDNYFDGMKVVGSDKRMNLPSNFQETKELWKEKIEIAVTNFQRGKVDLLPARKTQCLTCTYKGLCRKGAQ